MAGAADDRRDGSRRAVGVVRSVNFDRPDVLLVVDLEAFDPLEALGSGTVKSHAINRQVNPAFVYGRYRNLEHEAPQTERPCRECGGSGTQLGDDSKEPCEHRRASE